MKNLIILTVVLLCALPAAGQVKSLLALKQFLDTDFIHEFDSLERVAHKAVMDFKAIQHEYTEEEISRVATAYDASARLFNNVLFNIKEDLLDKDMRVFIAKYPEKYSRMVEGDLYKAKDYYVDNFKYEISLVTNGVITGAGFLALLPQIFLVVKKGIEIFKKLKSDLEGLTLKMIDENLIEKHRFAHWEEIQ